jgi:hypothetical protein
MPAPHPSHYEFKVEKIIEPEFEYELKGFKYLGRGPSVSRARGGWSRSSAIIYRCAECGDIMNANHNDYFNCTCGAIHLDIDYGRFGSKYGYNNILVYEKIKS